MINITEAGVINTNYYSDVFLKTFSLSPSPAGLVATLTIVANVTDHTTLEVQDKIDTTTFGLEVTEAGGRDGVYVVNSKPTIVESEVDFETGIGVRFVGTRIVKPKPHA